MIIPDDLSQEMRTMLAEAHGPMEKDDGTGNFVPMTEDELVVAQVKTIISDSVSRHIKQKARVQASQNARDFTKDFRPTRPQPAEQVPASTRTATKTTTSRKKKS